MEKVTQPNMLKDVNRIEISDERVGQILGISRQAVHSRRQNEEKDRHYTLAEVHEMIEGKKDEAKEAHQRFLDLVLELI